MTDALSSYLDKNISAIVELRSVAASVRKALQEKSAENKRLTAELKLFELEHANCTEEIERLRQENAELKGKAAALEAENGRLVSGKKKTGTWRKSSRAVMETKPEEESLLEKLNSLKELEISTDLSRSIFSPLADERVVGLKLVQSPPQLQLSVTKSGVPSIRIVDIETHSKDWTAVRYWASLKGVVVQGTPVNSRRKSMKM